MKLPHDKLCTSIGKAGCVIIILALLGSCASSSPKATVQTTNRQAPSTELQDAMLDQITVQDLRTTADLMARDIIIQPFVGRAARPPVVAVKPIENKTDMDLDPDIFQKTIRVKLMERAGGRILFRDEASYQYTIEERMKQTGKVQISSTTVTQKQQAPTRVGQPIQVVTNSQTDTTTREEGEVAKRVANVDYFLTGLIYSTKEVVSTGSGEGNRYFQFQFRLSDAQTGIIVWEKEYPIKRTGAFK